MGTQNKRLGAIGNLNLIESKYQFSTQFLNKSKHYYALCQTGREPSINSIYNLVNNINQLNETIFNNNPLVDKLIDEGKQIIDDRIIQWYN